MHTGICPLIPNAKAWNKIVYDLAVGALVTLFVYLLVVRLPDYLRRRRLKRNLKWHYRAFREDCIQIMLLVADGAYSGDLREALLEQDRFRAYFEEKVVPDCDRWHEFQNKLDERSLRELLTRMEMFRDEVAFILNNTDISNDEPFEFLRTLFCHHLFDEGRHARLRRIEAPWALPLDRVRRVGFDHWLPQERYRQENDRRDLRHMRVRQTCIGHSKRAWCQLLSQLS